MPSKENLIKNYFSLYQKRVNGFIYDIATPTSINFYELWEKDRFIIAGSKNTPTDMT